MGGGGGCSQDMSADGSAAFKCRRVLAVGPSPTVAEQWT